MVGGVRAFVVTFVAADRASDRRRLSIDSARLLEVLAADCH